jgi:ribosomal protein S27AE
VTGRGRIFAPRYHALRDIVGTAGGKCFPGWRHTRGASYCPRCADLLMAEQPNASGWCASRMVSDETYLCARCGKAVTIEG